MTGGGLGAMMEQLKGLQENMQNAQEEAARLEVTGEAGGGLVKVVMNGKHRVRRVDIDESLIGDDRDMLADLVAAAVNDAAEKAELAARDKMAEVTAGMPLPPGVKLPF